MRQEELRRRLLAGEIVPLTAESWAALADGFTPVETHDTHMAGTIEVRRLDRRWLIVEQPEPGRRALRPLPTRAAVRTFVQERLAAYDRLWDG